MSPAVALGLLPLGWLGFVLLNLLLFPRTVRRPPTKGLPKLSVLLPARNEARRIGPCVASLISQVYPDFELLVLDDHSIDGTREIARAAAGGSERFRLLKGRPLPEGWRGDSWARHQLAEAARGEFLLFLDSGIITEPGMLARLVATALIRRVDLLSGYPKPLCDSVGEILLTAQPMLMAAVALPVFLVPRRNHHSLVAASGSCLLIRRESLRRAAIRQPLDPLGLARLVKRGRGRVLFCNLADLCRCPLHRSPSAAWRSSVKSLGGRLLFITLPLTILLWLGFLAGPVGLIGGLLFGATDGELLALLAGTLAGGLMGALACRAFRLPGWLGLLMPLHVLLFAAAAATAAWRRWIRRDYEWEGRRYA